MAKQMINLNEDVRSVLETNSKAMGISMSAYISMLIMKADVELQMTKILRAMDPEALQKAIQEQMEGKQDG